MPATFDDSKCNSDSARPYCRYLDTQKRFGKGKSNLSPCSPDDDDDDEGDELGEVNNEGDDYDCDCHFINPEALCCWLR